MKKNYVVPKMILTVFGMQNDIVLASTQDFFDKYEDQPDDWNVWQG